MRNRIAILLSMCSMLFLFSCVELMPYVRLVRGNEWDPELQEKWYRDSLLNRDFTGVEVALRRAEQFAKIQWTPVGNVPSIYGSNGVYPKGVMNEGLPYSLGIWDNTHIGTQVSLYTYMTALNNPYSVLYTKDLRKDPYYGFDCATYYGTTCSNSVMFVLGILPPYYTYMIPTIPGMVKPKDQRPEAVELCDVLLKSGHVVMVYDISLDDDGDISTVSIFETTTFNQKNTWIRTFTFEEFVDYWNRNSYVRYKYGKLSENTDYIPSVFAPLPDERVLTGVPRLPVCTTRGDRASYVEGEDVVISTLIPGITWISLFRDDVYYKTAVAEEPNTVFSHLPYGNYKARLVSSEGKISEEFTQFEIINTFASGTKDQRIRISFASKNADAVYFDLCDARQNPKGYFPLSESDRQNGSYEMDMVSEYRSSHFKVYFKGQFGIVATSPIPFVEN